MTNELEKQFFDTFNIEPIGCNDNKNCTGALDCTQCPNAKYPQITDRILLELICILAEATDVEWGEVYKGFVYNYEDLKELILDACRLFKGRIKHQVRTLFEEG